MKTFFKGLLQIVGAFVFILVVYGVYGVFAERSAVKRAHEFCAIAKVGDAPEDVLQKAINAGAESPKWLNGDATKGESNTLMVQFTGLPPFSRHMCVVRALAKVTDVHYFYMD